MKYHFVLFILLLASATAFAQEFKFENTKHNWGMVREGDQLSAEFPFENTGNAPLIITDAKVQCTCTKVEFPKEPVKPGEKGVIKVSFDTTNKMDRQDRTVQLVSNAKTPAELRIKCIVLKAKNGKDK
jgi:hypothetical protein